MALLILGLVLFLGTHAFTLAREPRAALVARLGEGPYKGLYSLLSVAGVVLIAIGFGRYRAAGYIPVWEPPVWTRHLALLLVWPAFVMFVAPYFPGRIKQTLKHPMLAGVKLWAVAHLLANGDLGSIVLFGTFLGWAVFDRISLKKRVNAGGPPIPVGGVGNDLIALAVGVVVYIALAFAFHPVVIGVPVVGA